MLTFIAGMIVGAEIIIAYVWLKSTQPPDDDDDLNDYYL